MQLDWIRLLATHHAQIGDMVQGAQDGTPAVRSRGVSRGCSRVQEIAYATSGYVLPCL
jgi:hypothetical protein